MKKLCVFLLMLLVVATVVFAQEKTTVVIVPFDTVGVDETEADVLFEVFMNTPLNMLIMNFAKHGDTSSVSRLNNTIAFSVSCESMINDIIPFKSINF